MVMAAATAVHNTGHITVAAVVAYTAHIAAAIAYTAHIAATAAIVAGNAAYIAAAIVAGNAAHITTAAAAEVAGDHGDAAQIPAVVGCHGVHTLRLNAGFTAGIAAGVGYEVGETQIVFAHTNTS